MEDGKALQEFIRTVRAIAEFYEMPTLLSTMDWMLGAQGTVYVKIIKYFQITIIW